VDDAIEAGIDKFNRLQHYNQYRQEAGFFPINIGMAIHVGSVVRNGVSELEISTPQWL
jgi:hypothetical protein